MNAPKDPGLVVTFYSYKGGVGRTFALANIAVLLAKWGHRVLVIDWDLEAPGLQLYFKKHLPPDRVDGGLLSAVEDAAGGDRLDWSAHVLRLQGELDLDFLPAGNDSPHYVSRLRKLDWDTLYAENDFGTKLEAARDEWRAQYDFVLVDSRTGISDIGGICTVHLPDLIMAMGTANEQSLDGLLRVLRGAREGRQRLIFDRGGVAVVPVLTRFEGKQEREKGQEWLGRYAKAFTPHYGSWLHRRVKPRDFIGRSKVSHYPIWTFGEHLPVLEDDSGEPDTVGYDFETLAALLAHRLMGNERIIDDRDDYLAEAGRPALNLVDWPTQPSDRHLENLTEIGLAFTSSSQVRLDDFELRREFEVARTTYTAQDPLLSQAPSREVDGALLFELRRYGNEVEGLRIAPSRHGFALVFRKRDDHRSARLLELDRVLRLFVEASRAVLILLDRDGHSDDLDAHFWLNAPGELNLNVNDVTVARREPATIGYRLAPPISIEAVWRDERSPTAFFSRLADKLLARLNPIHRSYGSAPPPPRVATEVVAQWVKAYS